jgi:hypothetical protein
VTFGYVEQPRTQAASFETALAERSEVRSFLLVRSNGLRIINILLTLAAPLRRSRPSGLRSVFVNEQATRSIHEDAGTSVPNLLTATNYVGSTRRLSLSLHYVGKLACVV